MNLNTPTTPILLLFLGIIIKIYDDSVDNNLEAFTPFKEYFKAAIYIFSYLALIGDLQLSVLISIAFAGAPQKDLADDNFWHPLGLMTLCILFYNLFYSEFNVTLFSLLVFVVFGILVYGESRFITEEYSWRKLFMRMALLPIIYVIYNWIDNESIRKGLLVGSGYLLASIVMMSTLHWKQLSKSNISTTEQYSK